MNEEVILDALYALGALFSSFHESFLSAMWKKERSSYPPTIHVVNWVKDATPMEDTFFHLLMNDPEVCREVVSTILGLDVEVIQAISQHSLSNIMGRGLILDSLIHIRPITVTVQLSENSALFGKAGTIVNIEIQNSDNDDHQRRVRLHEGLISVSYTPKSAAFREIPNVITIFISKFDVLKSGNMIDFVDRINRRNQSPCFNGTAEIYLNTQNRESLRKLKLPPEQKTYLAKVRELLDLLGGRRKSSRHFPAFSARYRYLKNTKKGLKEMTKEFQAVVDAQRKDDLAQLAEKDRELKNKDRELNIKDKEIMDRTNLLTQILSLAQTKRVSLEDIVQSCGTELAPFLSALPNSQQPASAP